ASDRYDSGGGRSGEHARPLRLAVRVLRRKALPHAGACRPVRSPRPSDSWCAGSLGMVEQESRTSAVRVDFRLGPYRLGDRRDWRKIEAEDQDEDLAEGQSRAMAIV